MEHIEGTVEEIFAHTVPGFMDVMLLLNYSELFYVLCFLFIHSLLSTDLSSFSSFSFSF